MRALALAVIAWLVCLAPSAKAHEVRPALLQIVQSAPGDYDVTWKQPMVGDLTIHLVPHLSGGALDRPPSGEEAQPGFLIRTWRVRGGPPLDGQTAAVEGLALSVTDVLVRVTTPKG